MLKKKSIYDNSNITSNSKQLELLKQHFPNCFDKEGNFISHKMQEIVGESGLDLSRESYSLNWLGKSYARLLANENPRTLLREDKEHNSKEANQNSENLLIKGDNLEVLKHLTHAYSESIKMIYIDPPYNTGGDGFVYNDDRKFTVDELSRLAGIDADESKRILEFTASKANSHSAWLTFMYPRLYVARELLREDGVIFISIDDNEVSQLKLLCDEVFGEENFVGNIAWESKTKSQNTKDSFNKLQPKVESILCYSEYYKPRFNLYLSGKKEYLESDENGIFRYALVEQMSAGGVRGRESMIFEIKGISPYKGNQWKVGIDTIQKFDDRKDLIMRENKPYLKIRPNDERTEKTIPFWAFFSKNEGTAESAKKELSEILENSNHGFDTVKPLNILKKLIFHSTEKTDIILDFFAGSGTTAHAVMALNAEDQGNRKFITVQIDEKTDKKSEAYKAGYESIFDITKARIEKASEKLNDKSGFKIYETIPMFEGYLDDLEELSDNTTLFNGSELTNDELETLLTTWKVYDGMRLHESLESLNLGSYVAYASENIVYFMDKGFNLESLQAFVAKLDNDESFEPSKLVLFGYNFDSKHQREFKEALANYSNKKSIELDMVVRY